MTNKSCSIIIFCCALACSVAAQGFSPSARKPTTDGVLKADEYSFNGSYSGMKLGASLSLDGKILYLALEAPTSGWAAIGLGSLTMNGAFMVLGSVVNGSAIVSEQAGKGHGHSASTAKKLTESAVRESGGTTVLEIALPAAEYAAGSTLRLILSYGATDNTMAKHLGRAPVELSILK
jgi:hypothetical protein